MVFCLGFIIFASLKQIVMKKAFIADFNIRTRVIVDVPEYYRVAENNAEYSDKIAEAACKKMSQLVVDTEQNPFVISNVTHITEDIDNPYGRGEDDYISERDLDDMMKNRLHNEILNKVLKLFPMDSTRLYFINSFENITEQPVMLNVSDDGGLIEIIPFYGFSLFRGTNDEILMGYTVMYENGDSETVSCDCLDIQSLYKIMFFLCELESRHNKTE